MRSKLNRMMAKSLKHMPAYVPVKQHREWRILDKTLPLKRAPDVAKWLVVMVAPRRELDAVASLEDAGYYAWHPQMTVMLTSDRMRLKTKVNRPLFPRYLFVAQRPGACKPIGDCDHVTYIVGSVLKPSLLGMLSSRQAEGEFDTSKPPEPVKVGELVVIENDGPFRGLRGIVQKADDERCVIMLNWLTTKLSINSDELRKVA